MKAKRNITDLKENECIHIRNERDSEKLYHLTRPSIRYQNNGYISKNNSRWEWALKPEYFLRNVETIYPASDFLPRKRKNSKLWKEITRLDGRVRELEMNRAIKLDVGDVLVGFDGNGQTISYIVKEGVENEPVFTLPENWCVKITLENKGLLFKYWERLKITKDVDFSGFLLSDKHDGSYLHWGEPYTYTEITTEQFVEYVLKRDDLPGGINQKAKAEFPKDYGIKRSNMSIRDVFAGMAMQGHLAGMWSNKEAHGWKENEIAEHAYIIADAMIKQSEIL